MGILISGRGSNLQAILDGIENGTLRATVAVVIANRRDAAGLVRARDAGVDAVVIEHRSFADRAAFERELVRELHGHAVDLVCLAGFMRVLTPSFLAEFPLRVLNIHPSLLPSFPGVDAQKQALDYGVKVSGATVHLATDALDGGPIVIQAAVPVRDDDTVETLSARILVEEHRIYPHAIQTILDGGWRVDGHRFIRTGPTP